MDSTQAERCRHPSCIEKNTSFYEVEHAIQFSWLQKYLYFMSYNRYALLIIFVSLSIVAISFWLSRWYVWLPVTLLALRALYWAGHIMRQFPKKLHITKKFLFAQKMGTFVPEDVVKYCADPCYRVVARHALTTGGVTRQQQNRLMREYTMRAHDLAHAFVIVDPEKKRVLTFVGGVLTEKTIHNSKGVQP